MDRTQREQELATTVQAKKAALLALLTKEEQKTRRAYGSTEPTTFEDTAVAIAKHTADPRSREVGVAVSTYQAAINLLWTFVVEHHAAGLAHGWRKRKHAWLDEADIYAEVTFQLRHFVTLYQPGQGPFPAYVRQGLFQHLTEWAAKQGPVEVPQKAARGCELAKTREGLELLDSESYDPRGHTEDLIDGYRAASQPFEWDCSSCGARNTSDNEHCPCAYDNREDDD